MLPFCEFGRRKGIHQTKNGRGGKCKITAKVAAAYETSTCRESTARYEFPRLEAGEDVKLGLKT